MSDRRLPAIEVARQQYVQARAERRKRRSDAIFRLGVLPAFLVIVLAVSVWVMGPAWAAKLGHGTRGTFTAVLCVKQKGQCNWSGSFVSDTGTDQKNNVTLGDGAAITSTGQQIPAIDTGLPTEVFPADGGRDWLYSSIVALISALCLILWAVKVPIAEVRRRRWVPTIGRPSA